MAYGMFEDLPGRTASDKILHEKVFKNPKYDQYHKGLASMVFKFFDKKYFGPNTSGGAINNAKLTTRRRLYKPIIRKLYEKYIFERKYLGC